MQKKRLAELLGAGVLAEPADVVAEMLVAGGLDAREDLHSTPFARLRRPKGVLDALSAAVGHGWRESPEERKAIDSRHPVFLAVSGAKRQKPLDTLAAWQ